MMTFQYAEQAVQSPCYLMPNLNIGDAHAIGTSVNVKLDSVGISLDGVVLPQAPFCLPASFNLTAIPAFQSLSKTAT
jgi:hypothetical protein